LLVVNGCGDMSGTDDGVIGEDVVQQAVTVGSSYWTDYFSDENVAGYCRDGYLVTAMQCTGRYCDNMRMLCTYSGQKSIIKQTLSTFSEESPNSRICSNPYFVTQIQCTGDYCDNLTLSCSNFSYLQRNSADCYWTSSFSEEQSAMYLKSGYYLAGVKCTGSNCDNISMYGCRAVASPDGETTSNPMACYKGLCPTTSGTDSDGDGISDAYEAYLLEKFSPYFMFSYDNGRPEHFNPTDPAWYVNTSRMITYYEGTPFPNNYYTLAGSPLLPLYLGFDLTLKKKKDTACFDPGSGKGSQCATTQSYGDPNLGWYTIITQANMNYNLMLTCHL
jgi:hypothetical protein